MDDDQVPFATAPDPADGPTAPRPEPLPLVTVVTGVSSGREFHVPWPWVRRIAVACVALAVVAGISWLVVDYMSSSLVRLPDLSVQGVSDVETDPVAESLDTTEPLLPQTSTDVPEEGTRADDSLVDTAAAVASAWRGFKPVGMATSAQGDAMVVVAPAKTPGFRIAVDPIFIAMPEKTDDMVVLFGKPNVRGKSLITYWLAHHPGTVIDYLGSQPTVTGSSSTLVDVTYVSTIAQVNDYAHEKFVTLKWSAAKKTWSEQK